MVKNRITQVVFQTVYCVLAVIGFIASLGYFNKSFSSDFYIYYTNLSNYICFGIMFVSLFRTIKRAQREKEGYVDTCPTFKFLSVIMILVTFLVYNILLAKEKSVYDYFTSISNLTMHVILPIMFILDWVLFYQHGKIKWYYPLLSTVLPLVYVVYIVIRATIIGTGTNAILYPYFFLDIGTLGVGGFIRWIVLLLIAFIALGYIIFALDHIKKKCKK